MKNGAGTLTLASTNNNIVMVGDTNLNGGTLALNGGRLTNTQTLIGEQSGSSGSVTVAGLNSQLLSDVGIRVGYGGAGTLNITSGGAVRSVVGTLGVNADGTGTVLVDGAGSQWVATQGAIVGNAGTGSLTLANGGTMSSDQLTIGNLANSTGTATVNGAKSEVKDVLFLSVANSGTGTLNVTGGGTVRSGVSSIGALAGSSGSATVDGANSQWINTSSFSIGDNGVGTLRITNGGTVISRDSYIGSYPGSSGKVTVDGTNSQWIMSDDPLYVAYDGTGTLDIANGGTVRSAGGYVGYAAGSSGTVNVGGANSQWINDGALSIGESGTGTLNITSGGNVTADAASLYAGSLLNIASGATLTVGSGTVSAGEINVGTTANHGGTIQGNVRVAGGTLTNNGTITGFTTIESGTAKGAGNYAGGYSVLDGGRILFGNSPGLLSSGSATWNGGTLAFQINDATGVAGVNWGRNAVSGTLTLAASAANPFTIRFESLLSDNGAGVLTNFDGSKSYAWEIVGTTGGIVGFDASAFFLDTSAFTAANPAARTGTFGVSQSGGNLRVSYGGTSVVVVPEANTDLLALLAAPLGLLLRQRKGIQPQRTRRF